METISFLPQTVEYALRVVVWLAGRPAGRIRHQELAEVTHVPKRYLYRVLRLLVTAGLVESRPGPNGGFRLAHPADQTTILDVVQAVGKIERLARCPLGVGGHGTELCPLHRELDRAYAELERAFSRVTLADLTGNRPALCSPTTLPIIGAADKPTASVSSRANRRKRRT
ncbi:MAG: hypothetical protein KatS3mg110_0671 [Pirellulaceae bacterium]|nr:MAG: hypothetical protein KatS3mg110_0671 [Pirellulaceae bacterium]